MTFNVDIPLTANQISADLVAMNANWEFLVKGDGTANRVLRYSRLCVQYSETESSILVYLESAWNGDDIDTSESPHDITKGDGDTNWALNAGGDGLTIEAAGLTGNAIMALPILCYNKGGEAMAYVYSTITANDIVLSFTSGAAGAVYDLSGLAAGESLKIDILYITSV